MAYTEGQIYEGIASLSGGTDRFHRWIVVAPFGKTHIHSIDDPADLHCWPIAVLHTGLKTGTIRLVGEEPDHPMVQLQRAKEQFGVADSHLGLHGARLERMFELLRLAVANRAEYRHWAAGEIRALIDRGRHSTLELQARLAEVDSLLRQ